MPRPMPEWEKRLRRRLTVRDLHILKTVARAGSMAKAARDLGMSQPSVSEAMAKLEAALRVRLLDRGPRGIQPTMYADALLRREQGVSDELQQCIRDIEFLSNPAAGEIRVGCPENLACGFVPAIIDRLSLRYPKIAFHVTPLEPAATGFRELRERSVDVTVGRIVHPPLDDDLDAEVLFDDRLLVVAGTRSPWARRRKIVAQDLMRASWVHIPQDIGVNAYIAAALEAQGLALPPPTVSTYSMHVRYNLLSTGRFLALIWKWTLHFNSNGGAVKALPVDLGIPSRPVGIVRLKIGTLSPVVELFVDQAREVAKSTTRSSRVAAQP